MFERLDEGAELVVQLAHSEMHRFGDDLIATDHLLIGIIGEGKSKATRLLFDSHIDLKAIRSYLAKNPWIKSGEVVSPSARQGLGLTRACNLALIEACGISDERGERLITPDYLMMGILWHTPNTAGNILAAGDVDLNRFTTKLSAALTKAA